MTWQDTFATVLLPRDHEFKQAVCLFHILSATAFVATAPLHTELSAGTMSYQTSSLAYSVLVVTGAGTEDKKFCPSEEKELYFALE